MGIEITKGSLYVAKIKGSDLLEQDRFWHLYDYHGEIFLDIGSYGEVLDNIYIATIKEWNKLGINDTNADFEEAE